MWQFPLRFDATICRLGPLFHKIFRYRILIFFWIFLHQNIIRYVYEIKYAFSNTYCFWFKIFLRLRLSNIKIIKLYQNFNAISPRSSMQTNGFSVARKFFPLNSSDRRLQILLCPLMCWTKSISNLFLLFYFLRRNNFFHNWLNSFSSGNWCIFTFDLVKNF